MARRFEDPGPATEPDLVDAFKTYARIDFENHDALIASHLKSAREWFERQTEIFIAPRSVVLVLDRFPSWLINVGLSPVTEVSQLNYNDANGNEQTLAASAYTVSLGTDRVSARIKPAQTSAGWPATDSGEFDTVSITLAIGFATVAEIPQRYLEAVYAYAQDLYDNMTPPSLKTASLMRACEKGAL